MTESFNNSLIDQLGVLGYPLLICTCLILAIVFERFIFFVLTYPISKQVINTIVKQKQQSLSEDLKHSLESNPFGRVLLDLMDHSDMPFIEREQYCSARLLDVEHRLTRFLPVLKILATISPLLGLLGTVLGMIDSFKLISTINKPITPSLVSGGISQALLTTAVGLCLAILALVPLSLFQMRANKLMQQLIQQLNLMNLFIQRCSRN